jgi:hypothetical protein
VVDFPDDLTAREVNRGWFDNVTENQTIAALHAQRYFAAAKQIAGELSAAAARRCATIGGDPGAAGASGISAGGDARGHKH